MFSKNTEDRVSIAQIDSRQRSPAYRFFMSHGQIVEDDGVVALLAEVFAAVRADVAGTSGDEDADVVTSRVSARHRVQAHNTESCGPWTGAMEDVGLMTAPVRVLAGDLFDL